MITYFCNLHVCTTMCRQCTSIWTGNCLCIIKYKSIPIGCEHCYYTGYSGRKAIYEIIPVSKTIEKAIKKEELEIENASTMRKGEMISMEAKGDRMVCEFIVPSRGIIGLRNQLLTATAGEAIMAHRFKEYQPLKGGIPERQNGSLVSMENGQAIPYSIDKLQDRGKFFVDPGEDIYEGQVIGENSRGDDMTVNVTKTKKLSNVRSSGADDKAKIVPAIKFSLEEALEYIQKDEYVEVTPNYLRLRKIFLKEVDRKRNKIH